MAGDFWTVKNKKSGREKCKEETQGTKDEGEICWNLLRKLHSCSFAYISFAARSSAPAVAPRAEFEIPASDSPPL